MRTTMPNTVYEHGGRFLSQNITVNDQYYQSHHQTCNVYEVLFMHLRLVTMGLLHTKINFDPSMDK